MRKLANIPRGAVIADRYVVSEVLRPWLVDFPDRGSVLLALDAILDQPVIAYVSPTEYSGTLLDAAGRSALLTDPRIPSIQDAGQWNDFTYIIVARTGGTSLARVLADGPLDPQVARAVVGELATVITHAASRGLHHGVLGPESVAITADGDVIVRGIAIDAAIANEPLELHLESLPEATLRQRDAYSLVCILYACLTARWPGDHDRAGLEASGRKNNRILGVTHFVPSESVPVELEAFASNVVGQIEPGPRSASEVVRFLEPWDAQLLTTIDQSARTEDELFTTPAHEATPAPPQPTTTDNAAGASPAQLAAALDRIGFTRPGMHGAAAGVSDGRTGRYADRLQMRQASRFPIAAEQLPQVSEWSEDRPQAPAGVPRQDPNLTVPIMDRQVAHDESESPDPEDTDTNTEVVVGSAETGTDDGNWFMGGMFQTREQAFAEQQAEFQRERTLAQEARERAAAAQESSAMDTAAMPVVAEPAPKPAAATAAPAPTPTRSASHEKPRKRRMGVIFGLLAIIAAVVLVGVVLVNTLRNKPDEVVSEQPEPATTSAPESTTPPAEPTPAGPPPEIAEATPLDPEGDGTENNADAGNLIPGAAGSWSTDRYNSAAFGALKKGVGIALKLKETALVSAVGVESELGGGAFDIYVGTSEDMNAGTKVGSGAFEKGKVTVVTLKEPTEASYVFIWITELPKSPQGYRAVIPNVTVK